MSNDLVGIWACDHIWEDWDKGGLDAKLAIYEAYTEQASDFNQNYEIPVCGQCVEQRTHVLVSRRDVPNPWSDASEAFYKDALDEDERRTEAANREREALRMNR